MRSSEKRIDQYTAKTVATTVSLKIASGLSGMKSGFSAAIQSLAPIEQQVQALLNGTSTPTIEYPYYLGFAREMWGLRHRGIDGQALSAMAQSLHDKYVAYGLLTGTLVSIADSAFNVTVS